MHEVSVMARIVDEVVGIAKKNGSALVESVLLEIGDLTFLGRDQMLFAYDVISGEHAVLAGSKLVIRPIKGTVRCGSCGYEGALEPGAGINHFVPTFACPRCKGKIQILTGRECVIRSVKLRVDGKKGGPRPNGLTEKVAAGKGTKNKRGGKSRKEKNGGKCAGGSRTKGKTLR